MAKSVLLTSVKRKDSYPKMFNIQAPYCCGTISVERDNTYTEQMLAEMPNITFSVYTLQDGEYVLYQPRALTIAIPTHNKPVSFAIIDIPTSCIFSFVPNFDNNALISHNKTVDIFGGDKWTTPTSEFPLTITWDNTNIVADSEGSAPADTYTKEEIDQMLSEKVSEEQLETAIEALDVTGEASISAAKTIASWSETDGKVAITTQDISIPVSQVNNVTATSTVYGVANASGKIVTGLDVAIPSSTAPSGAIVPVAYDSATETLNLKYITISDVTPTSTSNVVCKTSS